MMMLILEFGGDNNGEDDEVEEKIELRRCEAREDKGPKGLSFVEEETRNNWY